MIRKNILANFIGRSWSILTGFLFIPLYINYLGFESYSIISFTLIIAGLMAVIDSGLTATLSREFARIDNSHEEKIRIFETLESSYFLIIGFIIILLFASSEIIANKWLILNTFDANRVSFFLKIISFDIGFQLLLRFYMGGLLGLEKQVTANIYQVGWGVLRNGLVVIALLIVPTLEMFFLWQTISTIVFAIFIGLSLRKTLTGQYKLNFQPTIEKTVLNRIWRFAGGMLLISLVASLNTQIDKLTISKLLSIESLGYYTLAVSVSMVIIVIVNPISIALLPRFTALYSAGKNGEATKLFHKVSLFVAILVFTIMSNIAFFAKEIIWIWTGKMELAEHVYLLIPIIVFAYALLSLQILPYTLAIANGYTKLNNILGISSLFITLPGYWIATKFAGAIGAASVFCGVQMITTFVYLYFINKKFLNSTEISTLILKQMLLPLLLSLAFTFAFSFIPNWVESSRLICLLWIGMASSVTLAATTILLVPLSEIKQIVYLKSF